ncbi:hypothetical protein LPB67_17715 [Undibacterium sp. Jales W-56]|uniref:hypothetical protein n=1 Tax=Undibacterium sp. Jales W-56 TaxID=2897325 RepID=UPI0021D0E3D5|nr:hypothetical protein [Undibacterium sp. Jales W-56]MCU6435620.1 hypothetical protein [Undibacterium sp. Jales W-56]
MFWLHHPQPVRPRKAVAEQTVKSQAPAPVNTHLIVIEKIPAPDLMPFSSAPNSSDGSLQRGTGQDTGPLPAQG